MPTAVCGTTAAVGAAPWSGVRIMALGLGMLGSTETGDMIAPGCESCDRSAAIVNCFAATKSATVPATMHAMPAKRTMVCVDIFDIIQIYYINLFDRAQHSNLQKSQSHPSYYFFF